MLLYATNWQTAISDNGMKKEKFFLAFSLAAIFLAVAVCAALCEGRASRALWDDFANPPDSAKPWCYWWWVFAPGIENNKNNFKDNICSDPGATAPGSQNSESARGCEPSSVRLSSSCLSCFPITNAWQVSFAYHRGISAAPPAPVTADNLFRTGGFRSTPAFGSHRAGGSQTLH